MQLMLVAARAVLLPLDALGMKTLVLHREVIAVLALGAPEDDLLARHVAAPPPTTRMDDPPRIAPEWGEPCNVADPEEPRKSRAEGFHTGLK
jgi:hypothetical protein